MAITITSNSAASTTAYHLYRANDSLKNSFERLASGLRLNRAKDDVAGFAISTRMEVAIRERSTAFKNVNDAIAMTQVADNGLQEGALLLQRMWELAVQAANGTAGTGDRQSLEDELNQLKAQLDHLADNTTFNNQKLLDGSMNGKKIEIGGMLGSTGTLQWLSTNDNSAQLSSREGVFSAWWSAADGSSLNPPSILTQSDAEAAIGTLSSAIANIASQRTRIGAFENRLQAIANTLSQSSIELHSARSKIRDADMADEVAKMTSHSIVQNASTALLAQANQQPSLAKQLFS
ncbi:flagellin [Candidatus Magnetaquicoccus inordinatus]|uniref:flagellin N-terminal helical domain-containing protein n=1 Tax=Candidatus Magnetaquicoccus inordinatus TaxID=2496818 RepID=UPI00102B2FD2|nr:flagellin [Candidatus Magnetaquicoccus inordinatus]